MTAVLEAPVAGEQRASTLVRRRGGVVVAAAVALLGLSATALLLWAPTTLELTAGRTTFSGEAEVVGVPGYGPRGTDAVHYLDGATVDVSVPLRNDSPLPVTVDDVSTGAGVLPLLDVRSVDGLPLRLGAGEQGEVVLRAVLTNCSRYHERQVQNVDALRVSLRPALPLTAGRTVSVPLDRPLLVHSPMIVGCPSRTLDRNDDLRRDAL